MMRKACVLLVFCLLTVSLSQMRGLCGLAPHEILVVYNSNTSWPESKATADYYCAARGIPASNEIGIDIPYQEAQPYSSQPAYKIEPSHYEQRIAAPLRAFLHDRFGSDTLAPGDDPIKAIVLCYGVPQTIWLAGRFSSVDGPLTLLFNQTPWGMDPIGVMKVSPGWHVTNPYYYDGSYDPAARTKPADFGTFRSSSYNDVSESAPAFRMVRLLDDSHAIAGTEKGGIFRGARTDEVWEWTAVSDPQKLFLGWAVSDICVTSSRIWLCAEDGAVMTSSNGGATWGAARSKLNKWISGGGHSMKDKIVSLSAYGSGSAWIVGKHVNGSTGVYDTPFVERYVGVSTWDDVSNFPSGFSNPTAVAVADAEHVWLAGTGGIIYSLDNGTNWDWCYQGSNVGKIRVRKEGSSYIGFAVVAGSGSSTILYTTSSDGLSWTALTSPTLPTGAKDTADICVVDSSHVTIAYGSQGFAMLNGSGWTIENTGAAAKVSVCWDGYRMIAGTSAPTVAWGHGTPGSVTWDSSYTIPAMHWKMRYIVSRLDGYGWPVDPATGIPTDVKGMIDRSMNATAGGTFVIDDHQACYGDPAHDVYSSSFISALQSIDGIDVLYDPTSVYQTHQSDVMGYSSHGDYDYCSHNYTTWFRPFNQWKDGAVGIFRGSSTDGRSLRAPTFFSSDTENPKFSKTPYWLKVYFFSNRDYLPTSPYNGFWLGLYSYDNGQSTLLASAPFGPDTENNPPSNMRLAKIDISALTPDQTTYINIHFPPDDPLHGQTDKMSDAVYTSKVNTTIAANAGTGVNIALAQGQANIAELIRDGCSATAGNVSEPFGTFVPQAQVILPQYASGASWGEAAYMGIPKLAWQEIAVGDPLMAPFATPPSVTITEPSADGIATGTITIAASATPNGDATGISRMEAWLTSGFTSDAAGSGVHEMLGWADGAMRVTCSVNTAALNDDDSPKYPDGEYYIHAVAFDNSTRRACGFAARHVCIVNNSTSTTVTLSNPSTDGSNIYGIRTLEAEVNSASGVLAVEFWLLSPRGSTKIGSDDTPTGNAYSLDFDSEYFVDGAYAVRAVAKRTDGGVAASQLRTVDISNSTVIALASTAPANELVNDGFSVQAIPSADVGSALYGVELVVSAPGLSPHSEGVKTSSPYSWSVDPADYQHLVGQDMKPVFGKTKITLIPYKTADKPFSLAKETSMIFCAGHEIVEDELAELDEGTPIALAHRVVTACDLSTLDGAFYIAKADRTRGIRVVHESGLPELQPGDVVALVGEIGESSHGEREIDPDPDGLEVEGTGPVLRPIMVSQRDLGGASLDSYTHGIDDVYGLYNIGLPMRVCGRVRYVDSTCMYLDDGSGICDGSDIIYTFIALNADDLPPEELPIRLETPPGVKVDISGFQGPVVGDYALVCGISSLYYTNGSHARLLRATSQPEIVQDYAECFTWSYADTPILANHDNSYQFHVGDKVSLVTKRVRFNHGDHLHVWCRAMTSSGYDPDVDFGVTLLASTALDSSFYRLLVLGRVACADPYEGLSIDVDAVYKLDGEGMEIACLSPATPTTPPAVDSFRPWPYPTADEILASEQFQTHYSEPGMIGWAIAQPDGNVVDLLNEQVVWQSEDGMLLGIKETYEPIRQTLTLFVALSKPAPDLRRFGSTIDIHGATLSTLSDGRRALVNPTAVYGYTSASGRFFTECHIPKERRAFFDALQEWPWRVQIAP